MLHKENLSFDVSSLQGVDQDGMTCRGLAGCSPIRTAARPRHSRLPSPGSDSTAQWRSSRRRMFDRGCSTARWSDRRPRLSSRPARVHFPFL